MTTDITNSKKQPATLFYIVMVSMWEFFSYYGMRALLILYLTQALLFSDQHAYALYGAYTALVYVSPIIGGVLADKFLGYRWAVIFGALLMIAGHVIIGLSHNYTHLLYAGLSFIICGYGLFKTNLSCLLGESYHNEDGRRESGFTLFYIGGNLGAIVAPIVCAWAAQAWGWDYGFIIAGIGMIVGLIIFLLGHRNFTGIGLPRSKTLIKIGVMNRRILPIIIIASLLSVLFFYYALKNDIAGWLLSFTVLLAIFMFMKIFLKSDKEDKKELVQILLFILFGTVFWAFDQQTGSAISLFIERNVIKSIGNFHIPAASFQSVNPFATLVTGLLMVYVWKKLASLGINFSALIKLSFGMVVLTLGFYLLHLTAYFASIHNGHTSLYLVVLGMFLIGGSELFVDPIAINQITKIKSKQHTGFLAGFYMLLTGAVANYLAAKIASLTSVDTESSIVLNLSKAASQYGKIFGLISFWGIVCVVGMLLISFLYVLFYKNKASKLV